jgi:protein phosphatase
LCEEIKLDALQPAARDTVRAGITNIYNLNEARATINRLRVERLLPPCGKPSQPASPTTQPPTTTTTASPPVASTNPPSVAPVFPGLPGQPAITPPPDPNATDVTPLPTPTPKPGVDCRTVG